VATTVGYASLQIIPSAKGFQSALSKEVDPQAVASGKSAGKGFGGGFLPLAGKALAGLGAAGLAIGATGFLKDAISQASDLNETVSKTKTIFGGEAYAALDKFSNEAAAKMGLSKSAALDAASSFGIFGKAAGLTGPDLSTFSSSLVGLSGDLASFYNTDPGDAAQAIQSALRGEYESIRRYGVLLDATTLGQKAFEMGLIKTTKQALTPQQKTLAAQALIMDKTKVAQGDFAKTSGGLANQQRILAAQFDNVKGTLGQAFLPIVLKVVSLVNKGLGPALDFVRGLVEKVSGAFSGPGASGVSTFQKYLVPLSKVFETIVGILRDQVLPFLTRLGVAVFPVIQKIVAVVSDLFVNSLLPAITSIYQTISENLGPVLDSLVSAFVENVLPAISGFVDAAKPVVAVVIQVVAWVIRLAVAILGKVLPPLIGFTGWLAGHLIGAISTAITWIAKIIGWIVDFALKIRDGAVKVAEFVVGLREKFLTAVDFVKGLPGKILEALGNLGTTLLSAGGDLIAGFVKGIRDKASDVVNVVKSTITDALPQFVKDRLGIASPSRVFADLGKWTALGFAQGVGDHAGAAQDAMRSAITPPPSPVLDGSVAGGGSTLAASTARQVARLYLDGRQVAEAVFEHGGREYAYGRA
jgi:hypothetical protein